MGASEQRSHAAYTKMRNAEEEQKMKNNMKFT